MLRYDMAELQMKLKQYEKAERTVAQALDAENNGQKSDLNSLMTQVGLLRGGTFAMIKIRGFFWQAKFYTLLAKIQERSGNLESALRTLSEAKDIRARLLKRAQLEQPESVQEQVSQTDISIVSQSTYLKAAMTV